MVLDAGTPFAAAVPYIWIQIQKNQLYAKDTKEDFETAIKDLRQHFGSEKIGSLSPDVVKPWVFELTRVSKRRAETCFRFLRHFNSELPAALLPELRKEWEYAAAPGLRAEYSVPYHMRHSLLTPVLDDVQCGRIMELCEKGVTTETSSSAKKFFAAALILVTGIDLNEACALYLDAFSSMEEFPGKYRLNITQVAREQTNETSARVGRKRAKRYTVAELEADPRLRSLALGTWITSLLDVILKKSLHPEYPFLSNESNHTRILHPKDYAKWLDRTFGKIVGNPSAFGTSEVSSKADVAKYFAETARHMLRAYGYMEEESRRQAGKMPVHTDAVHYVSLSSDTELVELAAIQDLWLANVRAEAAHGSTGNYQTQPLPHQLSYGHFRITVPPGTPLDTEELVIDLRSKFGVSYSKILVRNHRL